MITYFIPNTGLITNSNKIIIFTLILFLSSCGGNSSSSNEQPSVEKDIYDKNTILDVTVDMDTGNWADLTLEGRQVTEWSPSCNFPGYNYYNSNITLDGENVNDVDIRKKGTIGSLTVFRPSLKINLGRGDGNEDRKFYGNKRITLNNNHQDPSDIKQCLSYFIFAEAGLPTPQCNFAHVTAQQEDLGIYTNIESIKKPFLRRVFDSDTGNLYEGSSRYGEFTASHLPYFELKTNEDINDRSDLSAVLDAMSMPDDQVLSALDAIIDLDQFITFSAMEALVGHENGYNGNQNNFYIYNDPIDNRFRFIPYGTDQTFSSTYHLSSNEAPASVFLGSELMQRLWRVPEFRTRYDNRVENILMTVWDENKFKEEMDRMAALVNADLAEVDEISDFIDNRRIAVEAELNTERVWTRPLQPEVSSCPQANAISGEFDIFWTESGAPQTGPFTASIDNPDGSTTTISGDGSAQYGDRGDGSNANIIRLQGSDSVSGRTFLIVLAIPPRSWDVGDVFFHSVETVGLLLEFQQAGPPIELGLIGDGSIIFDAASSTQGASVKGSFDAAYVDND